MMKYDQYREKHFQIIKVMASCNGRKHSSRHKKVNIRVSIYKDTKNFSLFQIERRGLPNRDDSLKSPPFVTRQNLPFAGYRERKAVSSEHQREVKTTPDRKIYFLSVFDELFPSIGFFLHVVRIFGA